MLSTDAIITLVVLVVAIILFVTEIVDYTTTALLVPLALFLTGVIDSTEMFAGVTNSANLMNVFMFMIGGTLLKTGAANAFGRVLNRKIKSERKLMLALMITATVVSSFFNNMATATVLVPLVIGTCANNKDLCPSKLLMGVAIGCCTGGMLTVVGCTNNLLARSALEEAGAGTIGFFDFSIIGIPVSICIMIFMYFIGYKWLPNVPIDLTQYVGDLEKINEKKTAKEKTYMWISAIVFAITIIGMMTEKIHGIPLHVVCMIGAILLLASRTINENEAFRLVGFPSIILVAGLLPLSTAMTKSGAADYIAKLLTGALRGASSSMVVCVIMFVVVCTLTQFMSNTATAVIFYPIGIAISSTLGISAVSMVMLISFASQCSFMTPMATPANTYIMNIAGYRFKDFIKIGTPITILAGIVGCIIINSFLL